ncbi:hypothetical protein KKH35_00320 [Patescibacteria group bacterium]|nr:hypothetical protein [Patescibacteria group bacterium]
MKKNKLPQIKKDIKDFLTREEGNMIKKDVAKIAIGLLVLGISLAPAMKADPAMAACKHSSHSSHSQHSQHSNHSNHSNHSRGGWC